MAYSGDDGRRRLGRRWRGCSGGPGRRGVVGRVQQLEWRSGMESVKLGNDRGEWDELGGAPGALQLRRRAVMLGAAASVVPGR